MLASPYVDEDGNYLGEDANKGDKTVRVIAKSDWDKAKKDADGNVTKEGTSTAQSQSTELVGNPDDKYNHPGYQKGITISDKTWDKIESVGGKRATPFLENKSGESVYVKPENDGAGAGPGGSANVQDNSAQEVKAGASVYGLVDGIKTQAYSNAVFKIATGTKAVVNEKGDISYGGGVVPTVGTILTGEWKTGLKNTNFSKLYEAPVGRAIYKSYNKVIEHYHPY